MGAHGSKLCGACRKIPAFGLVLDRFVVIGGAFWVLWLPGTSQKNVFESGNR